MIPLTPKLYLYAGIGLATLIAIGVVYQRGKSAGQEQQKQENIADTKVQLEEMRKSAEAEFQRLTTVSEQAIQAAQQARQMSERRESSLIQSLASLSQQRQSTLREISSVPDSGLRGAIVNQLGIRKDTDSNLLSQPYYLPSEERKILAVLTDYPQVQKQTEILAQQVLEVKEGLQALKDELAATGKQVEAERALRKTYAQAYQTAFNLLRQKKRSARCLFIWKCGKEPLLSIPSPESLQSVPKSP